jgi:hypothetical protein
MKPLVDFKTYILIPKTVKAFQWKGVFNHFIIPQEMISSKEKCIICNRKYKHHGEIVNLCHPHTKEQYDWGLLCPGGYFILDKEGYIIDYYDKDIFESKYLLLEE